MKKITIVISIFFTLLFVSSCKMKIDGNFISLKDITSRNESDTIDAHGFPIPQIKYLYLYKERDYDYFEIKYDEYIDVFYDNGYVKTYRVSNIDYERDGIRFSFYNSDRYLYISKISVFFTDRIRSSRLDEEENPNYYKYHKRELYYISSVKNINDSSKFIAPSFDDIQSYVKNGEVRGKVKSVSNKVFCVKEMFGKDSLILINRYDLEYDKNGKLVSLSNNSGSNSFVYGKNGNIISEYRKTNENNKKIRVDYSYNDKLLKSISFYKDNSKYAFSNQVYSYDSNMRLKEIDYYRTKSNIIKDLVFDKKIKYEESGEYIIAVEYDKNGKEIRKNKYDKNYSIVKGLVNFKIESEYFNPFISPIYYYNDNRKINVKNNKSNIEIELDSPYEKEYEVFTYNENCDIVRSYTYGPVHRGTSSKMSNKYMMLYKYDTYGNWIERHSVLMYRDNKYEDVNQLRGYIERRDIKYFE